MVAVESPEESEEEEDRKDKVVEDSDKEEEQEDGNELMEVEEMVEDRDKEEEVREVIMESRLPARSLWGGRLQQSHKRILKRFLKERQHVVFYKDTKCISEAVFKDAKFVICDP